MEILVLYGYQKRCQMYFLCACGVLLLGTYTRVSTVVVTVSWFMTVFYQTVTSLFTFLFFFLKYWLKWCISICYPLPFVFFLFCFVSYSSGSALQPQPLPKSFYNSFSMQEATMKPFSSVILYCCKHVALWRLLPLVACL